MSDPLSLYIHVPFCRAKCGYCAFLSAPPASDREVAEYVESAAREIALHALCLGARPLNSVYFGGGTPSLLDAGRAGRLLDAARAAFGIAPGAEITLEANPTSRTADPDWLRGIRNVGVNRLSVGVQTFATDGLRALGRDQTPGEAARFVEAARAAGFDNLSLDLVFAVPGVGPDAWLADVGAALALGPEHLSIYCLEIHSGTPLGDRKAAGEIAETDDDVQAAMYHAAVERIEGAGLAQYEISNFARPGRESVHNLAYWRSADYVGVGPGASSHVAGDRWRNRAELAGWAGAIASGAVPREWSERLDTRRRLREQAVMRLRLREGVDLRAFEPVFGAESVAELLADCESLGDPLDRIGPAAFRIPRRYLFVSNAILSRLVD